MNTMSALEDAFVNVTFDEVSSTDDIHSTSDTMKETATPFYQDYIKHCEFQTTPTPLGNAQRPNFL